MSSKRAIRRRSCTRKVRHADHVAAGAAIHELNCRRGYQGRMDIYRCKFCNGYHIGHASTRLLPF